MKNRYDAPRTDRQRYGYEEDAARDAQARTQRHRWEEETVSNAQNDDRYGYRRDDPGYRQDYGQRHYTGGRNVGRGYGDYDPPRGYEDDRYDSSGQYGGNASDYDRGRSRSPGYFGDQTRGVGSWRDNQYGYAYPQRDEGRSALSYEVDRYPGHDENLDRNAMRQYAGGSTAGSRDAYHGNQYAQREGAYGRATGGAYQASGSRGYPSMGESQYGRGPKNYTRSDERIREDICEGLYHDHQVDASEINVEVKNAVVTLTGSVRDRTSKHRAEDIADRCSGVKDVENRLSVQSADRKNPTGSASSAASHRSSDDAKKH